MIEKPQLRLNGKEVDLLGGFLRRMLRYLRVPEERIGRRESSATHDLRYEVKYLTSHPSASPSKAVVHYNFYSCRFYVIYKFARDSVFHGLAVASIMPRLRLGQILFW
jgi:hypothetical protein